MSLSISERADLAEAAARVLHARRTLAYAAVQTASSELPIADIHDRLHRAAAELDTLKSDIDKLLCQ